MNRLLLVFSALFSVACFSQSISLHEVCGENQNPCGEFKSLRSFSDKTYKVSFPAVFELNETNVAKVYEKEENEYFSELTFIIKEDLQSKFNEKVTEVMGKNLAFVSQGRILNTSYVHGSPEGMVKIDLVTGPNYESDNGLIRFTKAISWIKRFLEKEESNKTNKLSLWIYFILGVLLLVTVTLVMIGVFKQRRGEREL